MTRLEQWILGWCDLADGLFAICTCGFVHPNFSMVWVKFVTHRRLTKNGTFKRFSEEEPYV